MTAGQREKPGRHRPKQTTVGPKSGGFVFSDYAAFKHTFRFRWFLG